MVEKILNLMCPFCGMKRKMIWRKGSILKKYRECFRCHKKFRVHKHIDKSSAIIDNQ